MKLSRVLLEARVHLGDIRRQLGCERWHLWRLTRPRRDHHICRAKGSRASSRLELVSDPQHAVDGYPCADREVEPRRVGSHVVRDLVLGWKRKPRRRKAHPGKAVVLGGCEDAQ